MADNNLFQSRELAVLIDRMLHRLIVDQMLDGFSDNQIMQIVDAVGILSA